MNKNHNIINKAIEAVALLLLIMSLFLLFIFCIDISHLDNPFMHRYFLSDKVIRFGLNWSSGNIYVASFLPFGHGMMLCLVLFFVFLLKDKLSIFKPFWDYIDTYLNK